MAIRVSKLQFLNEGLLTLSSYGAKNRFIFKHKGFHIETFLPFRRVVWKNQIGYNQQNNRAMAIFPVIKPEYPVSILNGNCETPCGLEIV